MLYNVLVLKYYSHEHMFYIDDKGGTKKDSSSNGAPTPSD